MNVQQALATFSKGDNESSDETCRRFCYADVYKRLAYQKNMLFCTFRFKNFDD